MPVLGAPLHFPATHVVPKQERSAMYTRWLGAILAVTAGLGVQSALSQPVTSCGAGQALQSFDTSGRDVNCINVPDGAALQGQINTEVTARAAADTQLQGQVNAELSARVASDTQLQNNINGAQATLLDAVGQERSARIAADDELRASIGGGAETSIVGTYTFSGTQSCLNSTFGFNPNLTPIASTDPMRAAVVSISTALATGSRTFNANGTGTAQQTTMSLNYPGAFFTSGGFAGVTTGGPSPAGGSAIPSGNVGTIFQETISFNWHVEDGRVIIQDAISPGVFTSGGRIGWSARVEGAPRSVGVLGKDVRVISITNENVAVETTVTTSPATEPFQEFRTPRICQRERTLRKL